MASPPDPHARSLAIWRITEEILETLQWWHGFHSHHAELASLRRLVEEARAPPEQDARNTPGLAPLGFNQATRFCPGCTAPAGGAGEDPMTWYDSAACQDVHPELFFPIGSSGPALRQLQRAKRVCAGCPVQRLCLEWAVRTGTDSGVAVWVRMNADP